MNFLNNGKKELPPLPGDRPKVKQLREGIARLSQEREKAVSTLEEKKSILESAQQAGAEQLLAGQTSEIPRLEPERQAVAEAQNTVDVLDVALTRAREKEPAILEEARREFATEMRDVMAKALKELMDGSVREGPKNNRRVKEVHEWICQGLGSNQTEISLPAWSAFDDGGRFDAWLDYVEKAGFPLG